MGSGICRSQNNECDDTEYLVRDLVPSPPMQIPNDFPPLHEPNLATLSRTGISKLADIVNYGYKGQSINVANKNDVTSSTPHSSLTSNTIDLKVVKSEIESLTKPLIDLMSAAVKADENMNYEEALVLYEEVIENLISMSTDVIKSSRVKQNIEKKLRMYMERADEIQMHLRKKKESDYSTDAELMNRIKSSIVKEKPNIKWSDVAGLEGVKEILTETLIMPVKFPHLITNNRKPWKGVLLFGVQGTGKSLLAKAAAAEANSHTFFYVTPSHILAKWLGESEKLVKYLFHMARQQKPSIIFIDEVDSFSLGESPNSNRVGRMKIEFLLEMQRLNSDNDEITVLGATSNPWNLDDTVLRWFEKKIHIPLPNEKARLDIWKMSVGNTPNSLHDDDFKILAEKTEGYSGKDIDVLIKDALMQPLRKIQTATHFVKVTGPSHADPNIIVDDLLMPCSACQDGAIQMAWMDVPGEKLLEPVVTMDDMLHSLSNSKRSAKEEDLVRLKKFMEDFGCES